MRERKIRPGRDYLRLEGTENAMVTAPPLMMLRLVRNSIERGYAEHLERLARESPSTILVPAAALEDLARLGAALETKRRRSGRRRRPRTPFKRTSLLRLIRLTRAAIRRDAYPELREFVTKYASLITLSIPVGFANGVKLLLAERVRASEGPSSPRVANTVIWSSCGGGGGGPKTGKCSTVESTTHGTTKTQCDGISGTWTPELQEPTP